MKNFNIKVLQSQLRSIEDLVMGPIPSTASNVDLSSWDSFMKTRFSIRSHQQVNMDLLSKFLTFPLTIALHAPKTCHKAFIVGARAEASLPWIYWRELNTCAPRDKPWELQFIGPEVIRPKQWSHTDMKESPPKDDEKETMYVMFNPGIHATPQLWASSLKIILEDKRPILLTSFNKDDFDKEQKLGLPELVESNRGLSTCGVTHD